MAVSGGSPYHSEGRVPILSFDLVFTVCFWLALTRTSFVYFFQQLTLILVCFFFFSDCIICRLLHICSDRILTCRIKNIRSSAKVGLVVTDLITTPVVSWRGWETKHRHPPPPPPPPPAQLSFFAQPRLSEHLSLRGGLPSLSARLCLRYGGWTGLSLGLLI